ncbi:hydrolase [Ferrovibrio sp.]|uniref:hydrolase n=1 Tax=Ferrovibrio sp. TaxID=1917215 RepID=UPI000CC64BB6|nr:hydrolase [Ferrovibrio sp.]PJI38700.1 MAG: hydrolase [Ferrovibrio sp.]
MDKLDPRSTALVLIDLQKGIMPLARGPHTVDTVLQNAAALTQRARGLNMPVVLVRVGWSAGYGDMPRQPVDLPIAAPPDALPDSWFELAPELDAQPADILILKRQWNAFHGTELDLQLRRRGVVTMILGGISTNLGVESTARAGWEHGYNVVLAEDACSAVHGDAAHRFSIETIMPRVSRVRRSRDILSALAA